MSTKGYAHLDSATLTVLLTELPGSQAASVYQNQTLKTNIRIWTGQATTTSGIASFFPTSDNTSGGTALFTNIYSVHATGEINTSTASSAVTASIKAIAGDKRTVTVNAISGLVLGVLGATTIFASNGTNVHLTIIGD